MKLAVRITQQGEWGYRARCMALPGCQVNGQSKDEAVAKIQLAIEGYLASLDTSLPRELRRLVDVDVDALVGKA